MKGAAGSKGDSLRLCFVRGGSRPPMDGCERLGFEYQVRVAFLSVEQTSNTDNSRIGWMYHHDRIQIPRLHLEQVMD